MLFFFGFSITLSLVDGPLNMGSVDFFSFEFRSGQQVIFFPILFRCFIHDNDTRLSKFVGNFWFYEQFLVDCIFFEICNLICSLACLKTQEVGKMLKMTVQKNILIQSNVSDQIWWFWCHDDGKSLFYPIGWRK